jgi:hypothetical protein
MGLKVENVTSRVVMLGDNNFESGVIAVAAGAKIAAGTVLKRAGGNTFAPVANIDPEDGDIPTAVMPFDLENGKATSDNLGFRALISGRVRADMLRIAGNPTTPEQNDMLRAQGIIAVKVTDLSQLDNQ